jgi:hypothetical protein
VDDLKTVCKGMNVDISEADFDEIIARLHCTNRTLLASSKAFTFGSSAMKSVCILSDLVYTFPAMSCDQY